MATTSLIESFEGSRFFFGVSGIFYRMDTWGSLFILMLHIYQSEHLTKQRTGGPASGDYVCLRESTTEPAVIHWTCAPFRNSVFIMPKWCPYADMPRARRKWTVWMDRKWNVSIPPMRMASRGGVTETFPACIVSRVCGGWPTQGVDFCPWKGPFSSRK